MVHYGALTADSLYTHSLLLHDSLYHSVSLTAQSASFSSIRLAQYLPKLPPHSYFSRPIILLLHDAFSVDEQHLIQP